MKSLNFIKIKTRGYRGCVFINNVIVLVLTLFNMASVSRFHDQKYNLPNMAYGSEEEMK